MLFLLDNMPDTEASLWIAAGIHNIWETPSWIKSQEAKKEVTYVVSGPVCHSSNQTTVVLWVPHLELLWVPRLDLSLLIPMNTELGGSLWQKLRNSEFSLAFTFASFQLQIGALTETQVECEWFQYGSGERFWHITKQKQSNRRASGLDSASSSSCK